MNDLPRSEAKNFLQRWLENAPENPTDIELISMLCQLNELVDIEFTQCSPRREKELPLELEADADESVDAGKRVEEMRRHRLALYAVLTGGLHAVSLLRDKEGLAVSALFDALTERSRGSTANQDFDVGSVGKLSPHDEMFQRARIIAACEVYPKKRPLIFSRGAKILGKSARQTAKLVDNFENGREPRADLKNLVETAKHMRDHGVPDIFSDLIT